MVRLLALQGASDEDSARLRELLPQATTNLDAAWMIGAGDDADLLVIDIDSVYGHMDWLRAQSSGRLVAVLTEHAQFEDADLVLHKPLELANLVEVLQRAAERVPARPAPMPAAAAPPKPAAVASPASAAAPAPMPEPPRERRLADWLADGALTSAVRLCATGAPDLVLDPQTKTYFADGALRALAPYCSRVIAADEWQPLPAAELVELQAGGKGQPFARLLWLCHALGSNGQLDPALDINARYKLARWPQIEREFPKHFRIATVMMKQAATLTEIAEQSGATLADVIDFTNAYNATGHIETEATPAAPPAARDTGRGAILARLRNPFGGG
jgi:hypothetical protein